MITEKDIGKVFHYKLIPRWDKTQDAKIYKVSNGWVGFAVRPFWGRFIFGLLNLKVDTFEALYEP